MKLKGINGKNTRLSLIKWGLVCLLFFPLTVSAQEKALAILTGTNKVYAQFILSLSSKLSPTVDLRTIQASELDSEILSQYKIIIPVGTRSIQTVSDFKYSGKVVFTLVPDEISPNNNPLCNTADCYSIYINQPPSRYLQLFKSQMPGNRRLVYLTHSANNKAQIIKKLAADLDIRYRAIVLGEDANIPRTLIHSLKSGDVLLALPDSRIYNATNARAILLSTYHANVPILAYSKSFTRAGALVGLYSNPEALATKSGMVIKMLIDKKQLGVKEYYPDEFEIEINSAVAESLNIKLDPVTILKRKIKNEY